MDLQTPLNVPPYYDDFDSSKNYVKTLFQPSVSVQARELNQIQTAAQQQIEYLTQNLLESGTIVQGCNFVFYNPYPYAKINDQAQDGTIVNVSNYKNLMALNSNNGLKAQILNFASGFQATDPNLNTLYLRYVSTGTFSNVFVFAPGDVLTIFNPVYNGIEQVNIVNGGTGFSNTDQVLVIPQITVTMSSGSFSNGDYITNSSGANLQIIAISNTFTNNSTVTLKLQPRSVDLGNASANALSWSLANNSTISNIANTGSGTITNILGSGYQGVLVTSSSGTLVNVITTNKGAGFTALPFATVRSPNNSTGYATLSLIPQNYVANVVVAGTSNSVGNGYAFGVTEGIIYQKGYFVHVVPQTVLVSKYSQAPDAISVAFQTNENIINSNIDTTLNDPAAGPNNNAPGANRLQLVANLVVMNTSSLSGNNQVFSICQWNQGNPYKQQQQTVYSTIGDTMASRTYEQSGNFVVDQFLTTTRSPINSALEGNTFDIIIDPGVAYIDGYRVKTFTDFDIENPKAYTTNVQNNYSINLNYGSYTIVNNVAGTFVFSIGDTVYLYSTAKGYLSNTTLIKTQNTTPQGTLIGNASIRSMTLLNNQPGQSTATYKLYLFNIQLANGSNFSNVASIYANNGSTVGICDVVQSVGPTGSNISVLNYPNTSTLLFSTLIPSLKNANNINYYFRSCKSTSLSVTNSGILTVDISGSLNQFYNYSGSLSAGQMLDLYVVPTGSDYVFNANISGTVVSNSSTANLIGTATSFLTQLAPSDYIYISNGSAIDLKQVQYIVNNTLLILDSAPSASANLTAGVVRVFPKNVPIPFGYRSGLSANVNNAQNVLTINFGTPSNSAGPISATVSSTIQLQNVTQGTKTTNRQRFVALNLSNNTGNTSGPWCLGVPDIFRLRGVWIGSNTTNANTSTTNYFNNFYIDHNQNSDFLDLGFLYIQQGSNQQFSLANTQSLLVEFDYFTSSGAGVYNTVSYIGANATLIQNADSQSLATLTSSGGLNTFEIPELFDTYGNEIDLIQYMDFRPYNTNTCAPSTVVGSAPVNPPYTVAFGSSPKLFPLPGSNFQATIEYYLGRIDNVVVDQNSNITSQTGIPCATMQNCVPPPVPVGTMELTELYVPPYPNLPAIPSTLMQEILNKQVLNQRYLTTRTTRSTIQNYINQGYLPYDQPRNYTMADIGNIDRRLQAVEYYVQLSLLEGNVASLIIPSSANASQNRYKFGYIVDDFTTTIYSDLNDPQYLATKENGDIVPTKLLWDVNLQQAIGTPPFIEQLIISQENATVGVPSNPNSQPVCALALANTVAYVSKFRQYTDGGNVPQSNGAVIDAVTFAFADAQHLVNYFRETPAPSGAQVDFFSPGGQLGLNDIWEFFPSSQAPPAVIYFYCYNTPTLIQVYQGNTFLIDSGSAQNLTAAEQALLTGPNGISWFNDQSNLFLKNFVAGAGNTVQYAGKISWNYTFGSNNLITVKTTTTGLSPWRWAISYPINGDSVGCVPPPETWDAISDSCTNGRQTWFAYKPDINGNYLLTSSVQSYDINSMWSGGANSVVAPGGQSAAPQIQIQNVTQSDNPYALVSYRSYANGYTAVAYGGTGMWTLSPPR